MHYGQFYLYCPKTVYQKYVPSHRHVSRSENLGGRAVRGGAKNLGGRSKDGAKIWRKQLGTDYVCAFDYFEN